MHKVDSSGANAQNEFTNGDTQLQIARTRLEAKWMNTVQRELCALVELRATVLSDTDDAQIAQSLVLIARSLTHLRSFPVAGIQREFTAFMMTETVAIDGRAGFYLWLNSSSAAPDDLSVIQPASMPALGRWHLIPLSGVGVESLTWGQLTGVPLTFPPQIQSGTFVGTLTGCTTAPTVAFQYRRTGNIVTLWIDNGSDITGISNSFEMSISGIPPSLCPHDPDGRYQHSVVPEAYDNGLPVFAEVFGTVGVAGYPQDHIVFHRNGTYQWALNSGIKGIKNTGFSITYGLG